MAEDPKENIILKDEDKIIIHSIWEEKYKYTVSIDGDVRNPGEYPLAKGMRVRDLIFSAGNVLESAYLDEAEIASQILEEGRSVRIEYRKINLRKALQGDPEHNILLRPYDRVFVKRIPKWREERYVTISGEVRFPGRYIIKEGERLSSVIERAGGFTDMAYLRGAVFTRESLKKSQQKRLKEYIDRLEKELLIRGSERVASALTPQEAKMREEDLKRKKELIAKLKTLKAKGRMVIRLSRSESFKGSKFDIRLEDGDSLYIPPVPATVSVIGAVYNQTAHLYDPDKDIWDYIKLSGGMTESADKSRIYVLRADGSGVPADELKKWELYWDEESGQWKEGDYSKTGLAPGDTIVVPERVEKIAWLREIRDITQILYQIAITTGVIITIF